MYMIIDVNSPLQGESLNADEPWTTYTAKYLNRTFAVVEAFKSYPNTLLFFSGNEVIDKPSTVAVTPSYVRAVTRDLKNYIAKHSDRKIPVGYSAADVRSVLFDSWNYFRCAENGNANDPSIADAFALNSYSWCGNSTFEQSGYSDLVSNFKGSNIPVFYSEYGCNKPDPRVFTEVPTIYGNQMIPTFSGGIVYEYAEEISQFGLVNISSDGSANLLTDFDTLKAQYAGVDFAKVRGTKASSTAGTAPSCNASLIKTSGFTTNFTLPSLPEIQSIINSGVSPAPSGKIITINNWNVKAIVHDSKGNILTGLAVKPLANDAFNTPGTNTASSTAPGTGTGTSTGSAPSASTSKPNSALGKREMSGKAGGVLVITFAAVAFVLGVGGLY